MFQREQNQVIILNSNINRVFDAIVRAAQGLSGFSVQNIDSQRYVIDINVGVSMFSWGERMMVSLFDRAGTQTEVHFTSASKLGTEIAAGSKNRKNIDNLINAMSKYLA